VQRALRRLRIRCAACAGAADCAVIATGAKQVVFEIPVRPGAAAEVRALTQLECAVPPAAAASSSAPMPALAA